MQIFLKRALWTTMAFLAVNTLMPNAHANDEEILNNQDDRRWQNNQTATLISPPMDSFDTPSLPVNNDGVAQVDEQILLANPDLLSRAMLSALIYNNLEGVAVLLPIYQKQTDELIEAQMVAWAKAVLATKNQDFAAASQLYQTLHEQYPTNSLFGIRLIQSLFANRHYVEAKTLLEQQPDYIQAQLIDYKNALHELGKPTLQIGGHVIMDKNINNAPKQTDLGGGWTANAAQSAHGVALNVSVDKKILLPDGLSLTPALSLQSKLYQDTKQYNELLARAGLSMGKANHKTSLSITPFFEQTHYAGGRAEQHQLKHFSDVIGIGIDATQKISPTSQLSVSAEISKNYHQTRPHLDGHSISISPSFATRPTWLTHGSLSLVADYQYTHTQDKDDSYYRMGLRASAHQQWQHLGLRGSIGIAQRRYLAPMPIFNQTQINDEYTASLSLWHRKLAYQNLMPRLTWQYQKTDSSVALYSYDKSRVFVELSHAF